MRANLIKIACQNQNPVADILFKPKSTSFSSVVHRKTQRKKFQKSPRSAQSINKRSSSKLTRLKNLSPLKTSSSLIEPLPLLLIKNSNGLKTARESRKRRSNASQKLLKNRGEQIETRTWTFLPPITRKSFRNCSSKSSKRWMDTLKRF